MRQIPLISPKGMGKIAMTYRNDPKPMYARFTGTCCKCKGPVIKGSLMYYWPAKKEAMCQDCGEPEYNEFLKTKFDEEQYNRM